MKSSHEEEREKQLPNKWWSYSYVWLLFHETGHSDKEKHPQALQWPVRTMFVPFRAVGESSVYEYQRHLFTIKIQKVCESRTSLHPLFHIAIFSGLCNPALELACGMVVLGALPHTCQLF